MYKETIVGMSVLGTYNHADEEYTRKIANNGPAQPMVFLLWALLTTLSVTECVWRQMRGLSMNRKGFGRNKA